MDYITHNKFSTPLQREDVSNSWHDRGYSCDLFVDPPGREWNNFVHQTNELVTVVEGQLRLTIEGQEMTAEPGDEIFIPKGIDHSVKNTYHDTTQWLYGYD